MICYWCHWGWPKPIRDIYLKAVRRMSKINIVHDPEFPLLYGPAHIVWADENWKSAQWCLDNFEDYADGIGDLQLMVVKKSLKELVELSDDFKEPPEDYDGKNPENFPPPEHWECEKI